MENNISCYVYTKKILANYGTNTLKKKNMKHKGLQFNNDLVTAEFISRKEKRKEEETERTRER